MSRILIFLMENNGNKLLFQQIDNVYGDAVAHRCVNYSIYMSRRGSGICSIVHMCFTIVGQTKVT